MEQEPIAAVTASPPPSHLDKIFAAFKIEARYEYDGRVFYEAKDVFGKHNFARDAKRCLLEEDWIQEKGRYYISQRGIVKLAAKLNQEALLGAIMAALLSPAAPTTPLPPPQPFPSFPQHTLPPPLSQLSVPSHHSDMWNRYFQEQQQQRVYYPPPIQWQMQPVKQ